VRRLLVPVLLAGPLAVGLLRYVLPYKTTDSSEQIVAAVYANVGHQNAVLWLGMIAILTLVPGVIVVLWQTRLLAPKLTRVSAALVIPAYLCLGAVMSEDVLVAAAQKSGLSPSQAAGLISAMHPSIAVQTGIFVVGHVLGTVLLGVAVLRTRLAPVPAAWALIVSQPIHFIAAVIVGSHALDLVGWSLTAIGMACVAVELGGPAGLADQAVAGRERGAPVAVVGHDR
jgi:hypothetical protein